MKEFTFKTSHMFESTRERLICVEQLWMSDSAHEYPYQKTHAKNHGEWLQSTGDLNNLIEWIFRCGNGRFDRGRHDLLEREANHQTQKPPKNKSRLGHKEALRSQL